MKQGVERGFNLIFLRFHLGVGVRIALLNFTPLLAAIFFSYQLLKPEFFRVLSFVIFNPNSSFLPFLFSGFVALTGSFIVSHRICAGSKGWLQHLPGTSTSQRREVIAAVFLATAPLLILQYVFMSLSLNYIAMPRLAPFFPGLLGLNIAAAQTVVPVENKYISRALSVPAGFGFMSGHWFSIPLGICGLILADRFAGRLYPPTRERAAKTIYPSFLLMVVLNWRALKYRLPAAYLPAAGILGLTLIFINNNDIPMQLIRQAAVFGTCLAGTVFCAQITYLLSVLFPPWPWSRSLPKSGFIRICTETLFLFVHSLLLLLPAGIFLPQILPAVLTAYLTISLFSSGAKHSQTHARINPAGRIVLFGGGCAVLLSLYPYLYALFTLLLFPLTRYAINQESRRKVSAWSELHYLTAGDSMSWSPR